MDFIVREIESILELLTPSARKDEWSVIKSALGDEEIKIPLAEPHLLYVFSYVSRFDSNSCDARSRLDEIIVCTRKHDGGAREVAEKLITFAENLEPLFVVPEIHQLTDVDMTLKKNELVSVFIDFLLHFLYHIPHFSVPIEDQIVSLQKELRFLLTVLGDTWLLMLDDDDELDKVHILLAEFEKVANKAGAFVHSVIFITTDLALRAEQVDEALGALLEHISVLKGNIVEFLKLRSRIIRTYNTTTKTTCALDSLFIVDSVLRDLQDLINRDDDLIVNVKDQIIELHERLMVSWSFHKGINVPPYSQIQELKEHVMIIPDAAYEAEYLINSFLAGDTPPWYPTSRLSDVIHKIKHIGNRFEEIKKSYISGASQSAKDFNMQLSLQAKRNSEVNDSIVGLEVKTIEILDQLVGGMKSLQIISIFGMPGLGKTTLAKILFNHPTVSHRFHKCSWCTVSSAYERRSLLVDILIGLGSEITEDTTLDMEEEDLGVLIYKSLKGRRYLIVMDDTWSSNALDDMQRYFPDDGEGSRILITSRNKDVAPTNSIIHELHTLSNDQCWELLQKKVFHDGTCPPQLVGIGKHIAASCCGLPIAVVVIAGILSTMDRKVSMWEHVGESLTSYLFSGEKHSVMQILDLSYKHLPDYLKPCFLYFGLFPEDTEIRVGRLVKLWVAEGFVRKEEQRSLECVAEEYLLELIDKSLVMVAKRRSDGGVKSCLVHDLLLDLCLRIAEENNFLKVVGNDHSMYMKHRRLYAPLSTPNYDFWRLSLRPFGHLIRSFLRSRDHLNDLNQYYLDDLPQHFLNMKLLRIFDSVKRDSSYTVWNIQDELPINLRYLASPRDSSYNVCNIQYELLPINLRYLAYPCTLVGSIGRFTNLEYLISTSGSILVSSAILNMTKLRCIQSREVEFDKECSGSTANNLQSLSTVVVYNVKDGGMLECVPHLRKLKCQCRASPAEGGESRYQYPDLRFLTQLESLHLSHSGGTIISEINYPSSLRKLTLEGLRLPWEKMSIIGRLPYLEVLKLKKHSFVGERWETSEDEFQLLRFLKLERLFDLVEWDVESSQHFPKLQRLVLFDCYQLRELPSEMGEIATLESIKVSYCRKSVVESATRIQEAQHDFGNDIDLLLHNSKHSNSFESSIPKWYWPDSGLDPLESFLRF